MNGYGVRGRGGGFLCEGSRRAGVGGQYLLAQIRIMYRLTGGWRGIPRTRGTPNKRQRRGRTARAHAVRPYNDNGNTATPVPAVGLIESYQTMRRPKPLRAYSKQQGRLRIDDIRSSSKRRRKQSLPWATANGAGARTESGWKPDLRGATYAVRPTRCDLRGAPLQRRRRCCHLIGSSASRY